MAASAKPIDQDFGRFIDPKVLARISNLELLSRTVVSGFINGLHRSPFLGLSMEFAVFRGTAPTEIFTRVVGGSFGRV